MIRFALLIVAAVLAGCASSSNPYDQRNAPAPAPTTMQPSSVDTPSWLQKPDYHAGGPVPAMEPNRKVSEQDCTHGVEIAAGNLRCKEAR